MLKVAIIGCGLIARRNHIPSFLRLRSSTRLVAVCDLDATLARSVAAEFGIPGYYADFSGMLKAEKPDIVDICTPPAAHLPIAVEAIKNGSHVLIEKPMALSVKDCDAIIETSSRYNKKICVVHNQIFNPAFVRAKGLVAKGAIGDFLGLQIYMSTPANYIALKKEHWVHCLPGGVLGETGPHAVYMALEFLDNIHNAEVCARKCLDRCPWSSAEDFRINLVADNGLATVILLHGSDKWAANILIIGTKGSLRVDLIKQTVSIDGIQRLKPVFVAKSVINDVVCGLGSLFTNTAKYIAGIKIRTHSAVIRDFVASVQGKKAAPVSPEKSRETMRIMEMVIRKFYANKT